MKILITGATGFIGGEALLQCLAHPSISKVVAFVRRDLPADVSKNPKLESVILKDFAAWPEEVLQAHADADGMIWAMGSYDANVAADLEYPLTFVESMARVLETKPSRHPFRCVHLSGKFVRQNQEEKLWWGNEPRKLKGLLESRALAFAESHSAVWKTFIVKPGGVVPKKVLGGGFLGVLTSMGVVFGENWSVGVDELAAYMIYLAIDGEGEEILVENGRIVRKGRELLRGEEDRSKI